MSRAPLPPPFYRDDCATIYHGDCRELLPRMPIGAIYLTDQPYGTGWVRGGGRKAGEFDAAHTRPKWDVWDLAWLDCLRGPRRVAAFAPIGRCEELCNAMPQPAVLYYRKSNVRPGGADREPIVVSPPPPRTIQWRKLAYNGDAPLHPCQKPIDVMTWLVESLSDPGDTIIDPFMGSGTTLLAAKLCGRRAIGIEMDRDYCATAAERLTQAVLSLT